MDDDYKPVTGLGKEDFALKDGGARQPVVSVEAAIGAIAVRLISWGAASPRVMETVDSELTKDDAGSRVANNTANPADRQGSTFQRTIQDTASQLASTPGFERRAILAVISAPVPDQQFGPPQDLAEALTADQIPLWTAEVAPASAHRTKADDILDAAVAVGGGMRWRVKTGDELADAAAGVAALLGTAQYFVTANLPAIFTPPAPIATRHDRGIVLVPMWPR